MLYVCTFSWLRYAYWKDFSKEKALEERGQKTEEALALRIAFYLHLRYVLEARRIPSHACRVLSDLRSLL